MSDIYQFNDSAMATHFQVRINCDEKMYAAQAAQAAFDLVASLEARLSRFRSDSDIARIGELAPGEKMRLSEPAFACLQIVERMERATHRAFCATPAALTSQRSLPEWSLLSNEQSILCMSGQLQFDLGAIGKGFALDRMAELLCLWDCHSFLLIAGGSSVMAGDPPANSPGWSCGLGEDEASHRFFLTHASLSGSGLAVQGPHILDPRNGRPASRRMRAWALADTAAESDALSTACMVLGEPELEEILAHNRSWLTFLESGEGYRPLGRRVLPIQS
jgi:thiamine biosynthesis lipoprotein